MIGCPKKERKNYLKKAFEQRNEETWIKFNFGLALIGLPTTGPTKEYKWVAADYQESLMKCWGGNLVVN